MTDQHPITPPPELVEQWATEYWGEPVRITNGHWDILVKIATQAARWGYEQRGAVNEAKLQKARDEELEACVEYIAGPGKWFANPEHRVSDLRAARRPKPRSQAEEAIAELDGIMDELHEATDSAFTASTIRRALKRLRELEALDDCPTPDDQG